MFGSRAKLNSNRSKFKGRSVRKSRFFPIFKILTRLKLKISKTIQVRDQRIKIYTHAKFHIPILKKRITEIVSYIKLYDN